MRVTLYLQKKLINFNLPKQVSGSFSFDEDNSERSKLLNIEAREDSWFLYSTTDSLIVSGNDYIKETQLLINNFYKIRRFNVDYIIFVTEYCNEQILSFNYDQNINLLIGNSENHNFIYKDPNISKVDISVKYQNGNLILENKSSIMVYLNEQALLNGSKYIKNGDKLEIFGMKIYFLSNILLVNNIAGKICVDDIKAGIKSNLFSYDDRFEEISFADKDLYEKENYFSKSPRIRRIIEEKEIKLDKPPAKNQAQELPVFLVMGTMLAMGVSSSVLLLNNIIKLNNNEVTIDEVWPSLVTGGAMLISSLVLPIVTRLYNKHMKKKNRKELVEKYTEYLNKKEKEFISEKTIQKDILNENLITVEQCLNIINERKRGFWDKRVDQNDFLITRIGFGNEKLKVEVKYPEDGFTIEEDELKKNADEVVERNKLIENVPVSYSFFENITTAIMSNNDKKYYFLENMLLQLLTFYSYDDLKIVLFTDISNEERWSWLKYLNHNFDATKNFRFFSSNSDNAKRMADYVNHEIDFRLSLLENNKNMTFRPHYLIVVDGYDNAKRFDFINKITERSDSLGFSLVILENKLSNLPSKCNNFITISDGACGVLKNSYDKQEYNYFRDEINYTIDMNRTAKILSNIPIELAEGNKNLPEAITFLEMLNVSKVEQLNVLNRWNINDSTTSLKAEIGIDENEEIMYLDLHEKFHGPHGLIAGMTGSGKSEFIITYILSMAINYSPEYVSFILIDYKGGGLAFAFENKVSGVVLPHLAGTITNLDKAEMDRTLVSIDSELKRRQRLFNEVRDNLGESTIDIYKYQKFYREGKIKEAIPHLFIICDEFAELKSQQPEFMDNLISVARVGRSLGVHLILATQKPSGVVNDQIWSNTKFRVCLKVQDASDSNEMIKRPEAANLKQTGRFYLQVGYNEFFALGQSGWCGAKYYPQDKIIKQDDKSLLAIDNIGSVIKSIKGSAGNKVQAQGEQLLAVLNNIIEVSQKNNITCHKLWLDNIPEIILVEDLITKYKITSNQKNIELVVGEYDAPEKQTQNILNWNPLKDGNTIVYGMDGSENEKVLETILYSSIIGYRPENISFYILDYGSESLRKYEKAPHVGSMIFNGEEDKFNKYINYIKEEKDNRKKLQYPYNGSFITYNENNEFKLPIKVFIVNNYDSLYSTNNNVFDIFPDLVRDSERYGIVFIFTATAGNSIPSKISQGFNNQITLKLKDTSDYASIFACRVNRTPREIFGRGLINIEGVHEFQIASICQDESKLAELINQKIEYLKSSNVKYADEIPTLPEKIEEDNIKNLIKDLSNVPIGMKTADIKISKYNFINTKGTIISATNSQSLKVFAESLTTLISKVSGTTEIVFDGLNLLENKASLKNYFKEDFENILNKIIEFIEKNQENTNNIIINIIGIDSFIKKVNNKELQKKFFDIIKLINNVNIIIVDDYRKIKNYLFESWFTDNFNSSDGIWVGRGIQDQNIFKISGITKEMMKNINVNLGYKINDGILESIQLLEFYEMEEEENEE